MAKRRGFFAELQHQAAMAERERQRANAAAVREAARRQKEMERARAAAERARTAAARSDAKARAEAEREAKRLYVAAQEAEVESLNAALASQLADIDNVLRWTLDIDDHVDLDALRQVAEHPRFSSRHDKPISPPLPVVVSSEPTFAEPPAPSGVGAVFGKKKHAAAVASARADYDARHAAWREEAASVPVRQLEQMNRHQAAEAERQQRLAADRAEYDAECLRRQAEVDAANAELASLQTRLNSGEKAAVEEYLAIVFGNSVYPDDVEPDIEHSYDPSEGELEIGLGLPAPSALPVVKTYRYVKSKDEIAQTPQSAKEQRDRYAEFVHGLVLRTLHEVWESDRRGQVKTISLVAGVEHVDPATGRPTTTPLIAVATEREAFEEIDLAHVTPLETLKHLRAVVSKNPHALAGITPPTGVRG